MYVFFFRYKKSVNGYKIGTQACESMCRLKCEVKVLRKYFSG